MSRLGKWFRRDDDALQEEIRAHIEMETRDNLERGLPPDEAKCAAHRTFGNISVLSETIREAKPTYWLDTLAQDVRYGLRLLKRTPWLAGVIMATLAVGIGLSSSVFTLLEAELFRAKVDRDPVTGHLTSKSSCDSRVTRGRLPAPSQGPSET